MAKITLVKVVHDTKRHEIVITVGRYSTSVRFDIRYDNINNQLRGYTIDIKTFLWNYINEDLKKRGYL